MPIIPGPGNAPFMTQSLVDGFFRSSYQEALNANPVLNEFLAYGGINGQPRMLGSKVVSVDNILNTKTLASLMGSPYGLPEAADLPQFGQVEMRALYTHQHLMLAPDFLVAMREAGQNPGGEATDATVAAQMQEYTSYIRQHSMRTFELWCCNLLQGGTFTQTVSGVVQNVVTGITPANIGGNFATASTDIPGLTAKAARTHRAAAGNQVDLIIWPDIVHDYFAANDVIQSWIIRQGMTPGIIDMIPDPLKSSVYSKAREIFHLSTYKNTPDGADQNFWSTTKMAMVSLNKESKTLMCGTHPLVRPDLTVNRQEAFTRHMWSEDRTGEIGLREVATMMFGLGDIKQISVWNINA